MNYEDMTNNKVTLSGVVVSQPAFSHEVYGEGFYEFMLSVLRLSDAADILPVTISERLMHEAHIEVGSKISVAGQFRSYNKLADNHSRLMLTVFARSVCDYDEELNPNVIELEGYICKNPMYRTTPFKREICDILLAVNRAYNKSDYIPCIAWGRNARYVNTLQVGDKIYLTGRIQSREYCKQLPDGTEQTRVAYEVSISRLMTETQQSDSKGAPAWYNALESAN